MIVCKICILKQGLKEADFKNRKYFFETEEEFYNHLEMEHDIAVRREGEIEEQAFQRVKKKNIRIGTEDCRCSGCLAKRTILKLPEVK